MTADRAVPSGPGAACGASQSAAVNGLRLQLHEWAEPGRPLELLLHSKAAHSHWSSTPEGVARLVLDWDATPRL